jgi:hypothetical protein
MFGRLKDFRRIATRYDKLAANFLAAVHLAAAVSYWLRVRTLTLHERITGWQFLQSCDADMRPNSSLRKFILTRMEKVQQDDLRVL